MLSSRHAKITSFAGRRQTGRAACYGLRGRDGAYIYSEGGGGCACAIHLKANELTRPSYLDGGVSQPYFYIRLTQRRAKRHHPARPVEWRQRVAKHDDMHAPDHTTMPSLIYSKVWTIMPCKETSPAAKSNPTTHCPEYASAHRPTSRL